jgi:hypothetical protein
VRYTPDESTKDAGPASLDTTGAPRETARAEIVGADTASALGLTVKAYTPVLDLCRKLIAAGQDPERPLHAYRGDVLCLRIPSIGECGKLRIRGKDIGFEPMPSPSPQEPRPLRRTLRGYDPSVIDESGMTGDGEKIADAEDRRASIQPAKPIRKAAPIASERRGRRKPMQISAATEKERTP